MPVGMERGQVKDTPIPGLSNMADGGDILETGRSGRVPYWARKRRSPTWDHAFDNGGDCSQPIVLTHPLHSKPSGKGAMSSEVFTHAGKLSVTVHLRLVTCLLTSKRSGSKIVSSHPHSVFTEGPLCARHWAKP